MVKAHSDSRNAGLPGDGERMAPLVRRSVRRFYRGPAFCPRRIKSVWPNPTWPAQFAAENLLHVVRHTIGEKGGQGRGVSRAGVGRGVRDERHIPDDEVVQAGR